VNILDVVIVVAAVAYGIGGFRHGAIVGALSMLGFFGGAAIGVSSKRTFSHLSPRRR